MRTRSGLKSAAAASGDADAARECERVRRQCDQADERSDEQRVEDRVGERAADQAVDLLEAVALDHDRGRERTE
jgi:hypothetical protein